MEEKLKICQLCFYHNNKPTSFCTYHGKDTRRKNSCQDFKISEKKFKNYMKVKADKEKLNDTETKES